jgi:subtilase family serine protease
MRPALTSRAAHVCGTPRRGRMTCAALVRLNVRGRPAAGTLPAGYGPADLRNAYALGAAPARGRTVAIVDAFHDPTAAADLAKYRATFGLPPCPVRTGCFRQVDQTGSATHHPAVDAGWAGEISLDLDMVSAACPSCSILLVEAASATMRDLATAENYAATQGVAAISNSFGGPDTSPNAAFDHPGIAITASTGDNGYGVEAPASFASVIAVGGTSLNRAPQTARGWSESAWSGAGSGCSTRNARPAWQGGKAGRARCSGRAVADVAAVADPNTGVAVFDSTPDQGSAGWQVFGGTSASAPFIAALYAASGRVDAYPAALLWAQGPGLTDVTAGANGRCASRIWCTAAAGWDGPTGWGTPRGLAAL